MESRHVHGVGVDSRADIYAALTQDRSVDKFIRTGWAPTHRTPSIQSRPARRLPSREPHWAHQRPMALRPHGEMLAAAGRADTAFCCGHVGVLLCGGKRTSVGGPFYPRAVRRTRLRRRAHYYNDASEMGHELGSQGRYEGIIGVMRRSDDTVGSLSFCWEDLP